MSQPTKHKKLEYIKMSIIKTVATHSGKFHADEVLAVAVLKLIYDDIKVIRTRDPEIYRGCDIAVDVGGGTYDHHQPGGNGERPNGIPYASSGLIWRDFGETLIKKLHPELNDTHRTIVHGLVDHRTICAVDAKDNGVPWREGPNLFEWVTIANPTWQETGWQNNGSTLENERFDQAVEVSQKIIKDTISHAAAEVHARKKVLSWINKSSRILVLYQGMPWQNHIQNNPQGDHILFVVYPSGDQWNVQTVPAPNEPRSVRKPFPEEWGGLTGQALAEVSGVEDAVFCHRGGFIAASRSLEGAVKLARAAIAA